MYTYACVVAACVERGSSFPIVTLVEGRRGSTTVIGT